MFSRHTLEIASLPLFRTFSIENALTAGQVLVKGGKGVSSEITPTREGGFYRNCPSGGVISLQKEASMMASPMSFCRLSASVAGNRFPFKQIPNF